ncbi:EF-P beta-lysylation protein EpmB [Marinobacter salicampi]|uniref:EF-P beta-lysylation protein EpmB n=1 Tax=Marinobacter salicampi TaxID=435907 RepID=UPI00140DE98B|nr:EF-P beta-lysylation protein EpmB [Marinobacter salicampi]
MIQRTHALVEARHPDNASPNWRQQLTDSITDPAVLLETLGLDPQRWLGGARAGHQLFPVRVPAPYLARIRYGDPHDPLLRQVLPLTAETDTVAGFVTDPLEEASATAATGLIRKYKSRALLMVTGQCAINCRYCFRRHFPYEDHRLSPQQRRTVLETLESSPEINEIIFSGGDPLVANDRLLAQWAEQLAALPGIKRLRIHTRLPVVIPARVDAALLGWLDQSPLQKVMVLHINHPNEIDHQVRAALSSLQAAGVTLLNQSVILKGVNDDSAVLAELSESLFASRVMPYYLHAFDPVAGAHHFDTSDEVARGLVRELQAILPGFLVPKLVREIPGQMSKTLLDP